MWFLQVLSVGAMCFWQNEDNPRPVISVVLDLDISHMLAEHLHGSKIGKFAYYLCEICDCRTQMVLGDLLGLT